VQLDMPKGANMPAAQNEVTLARVTRQTRFCGTLQVSNVRGRMRAQKNCREQPNAWNEKDEIRFMTRTVSRTVVL
jgi:hypothetical protein